VVAIAIGNALAPFCPSAIRMTGPTVAASVIFVGSHLALAIGRVPGLNIDRAGIALMSRRVVSRNAATRCQIRCVPGAKPLAG
jgi:hypothetical protein